MKRILTIITDLLIVLGSILLSFKLLEVSHALDNYQDNLEAFYTIAPLIVIMYLFFMYTFGLYNMERQRLQEVVYTVFLISAGLTFGIMATCFFIRDAAFAYPRSVIFLSAVLYFTFLSIWRGLIWKTDKRKHGIRPVAVVGNEDAGILAENISTKYSDIYRVDFVCDENNPSLFFFLENVSEIFITSEIGEILRERIIFYAADKEKSVFFVPKYSDIGIINSQMYKTDDISTFRISRMNLSLEERLVKRVFDLFFTSIATLIALPLGIVVSFLVKLDGGPIFYRQERLTIGGKHFNVLKFRTMILNAEKISGPVFAGENDPRITKVGRFIRATRLDELPQLFNILKGDMSIVGPRPERPFFVSGFEGEIAEYRHRMKVKAGLTGLAQIYGKYNTTAKEKLRYDLLYISKYSILNDFLLCLQTIKILFMKESTAGVEATIKKTEIKSTTSISIENNDVIHEAVAIKGQIQHSAKNQEYNEAILTRDIL